jgi:CO dehydrogenase/acetyl-CoA synthase epsilon subunit
MKRLADWIGGAVWGVVAYRLFKRWRRPAVATGPAVETDDRAEELRAKLAETRSEEPTPAEPEESAGSVEERRRRVYEEGRAAIDQMHDG